MSPAERQGWGCSTSEVEGERGYRLCHSWIGDVLNGHKVRKPLSRQAPSCGVEVECWDGLREEEGMSVNRGQLWVPLCLGVLNNGFSCFCTARGQNSYADCHIISFCFYFL